VNSLLKPLCVIALLVCKLAQGAIVALPAEINACPQHSMQQMATGTKSMSHPPCCRFAGCDCLQAPALAGPGLQTTEFVGATVSSAPVPRGQRLSLANRFFRPPIA
jgi:hypothetical protein